jgi:hypothetical protein
MHADDASLGHKILVLGAEGPVVFILAAMFLIFAASISFAALVCGLLLRLASERVAGVPRPLSVVMALRGEHLSRGGLGLWPPTRLRAVLAAAVRASNSAISVSIIRKMVILCSAASMCVNLELKKSLFFLWERGDAVTAGPMCMSFYLSCSFASK